LPLAFLLLTAILIPARRLIANAQRKTLQSNNCSEGSEYSRNESKTADRITTKTVYFNRKTREKIEPRFEIRRRKGVKLELFMD
jgi:CxxC motif-containing protein